MSYNHLHQVMNNTKWEEIREAMSDYPGNCQWRTKDIENDYISPWDGEWYYHFQNGDYKFIEWLEIKAETEELQKDLIAILHEIHAPGKFFKDAIRVYGYVETGAYIEYL